jgi:hypothetical protein
MIAELLGSLVRLSSVAKILVFATFRRALHLAREMAPAHNEDNGRFADYFIHLLLGVKLRDAPVESTIWIQRI